MFTFHSVLSRRNNVSCCGNRVGGKYGKYVTVRHGKYIISVEAALLVGTKLIHFLSSSFLLAAFGVPRNSNYPFCVASGASLWEAV